MTYLIKFTSQSSDVKISLEDSTQVEKSDDQISLRFLYDHIRSGFNFVYDQIRSCKKSDKKSSSLKSYINTDKKIHA